MKKLVLLLLLGGSVLLSSGQKVSGTVYSEHDAITKTRDLWAAFVKGDKETFLSFYADSVIHAINGTEYYKLRKDFGGYVDWWKGFDQLKVEDDKPAFPDAIMYNDAGIWVQDWIKFTGIHKETGIVVEWRPHNIYRFDKNGKIDFIHQYFDDSIFDEITNSNKTIENGKIFVNHPYINTVRKLCNAYCSENLEEMKAYYASKATFSNIELEFGKTMDLAARIAELKGHFAYFNNIGMTQVGYPDCIYYEKNEMYVVYSWWAFSGTTNDGKKYSKIPVMLSHTFDKDGKIVEEQLYMSSKFMN